MLCFLREVGRVNRLIARPLEFCLCIILIPVYLPVSWAWVLGHLLTLIPHTLPSLSTSGRLLLSFSGAGTGFYYLGKALVHCCSSPDMRAWGETGWQLSLLRLGSLHVHRV